MKPSKRIAQAQAAARISPPNQNWPTPKDYTMKQNGMKNYLYCEILFLLNNYLFRPKHVNFFGFYPYLITMSKHYESMKAGISNKTVRDQLINPFHIPLFNSPQWQQLDVTKYIYYLAVCIFNFFTH